MWQLAEDPIVREYFAILGVNGVPLGIPEVLAALQTGSIQACYGPPLAAVTLQWYTHLRYMTDRPSAYGIGALVVRKEAYGKLSPEDQRAFREGARANGAELVAQVRKDNVRARNAMLKAGIEIVPVPEAAHAILQAAGRQVWERLAGKLYPRELLDRVVDAAARAPR
jgi:TRAP-type C4-dicarboxylate transport system substrate-binding protein